jgi:hypothetical protein
MKDFMLDYSNRVEDYFKQMEKGIQGVPIDGLDWVPGEDMNSIAAMVVHIVGAFRFWIGDIALGENSNRDRAAEFAAKGLVEGDLQIQIDEMRNYFKSKIETFESLKFSDEIYSTIHQEIFSVGWCLLHALEHTAVHVGHLQVTKQVWEQK